MDFTFEVGSTSSAAASTSDPHRHSNIPSPDPPNSPSDESISEASSQIDLLLALLPTSAALGLYSLADTDCPARSLLLSRLAYSSVSASLSSPTSGSKDDRLCNWLYDTYQSGDADLRLVVLSYLPIISSVYLHRIHHIHHVYFSDSLIYLSGFEAVLLAIYSSETRARNGRPVTVSIPDLSESSMYLPPQDIVKSSSNSASPLVRVLSPPLEQQMSVKSTKRAGIIGVAFDCYYKEISHMPKWSKRDFCKFATVWAGPNCPCTSEFDDEIEIIAQRVNDFALGDGNSTEMEGNDARIPLPWELLQPILRILGHCLLEPLNAKKVKKAASIAVRYLYARASHDLVPQAILATRSLIQLSRRAREEHNYATIERLVS